MKFIIEHLEKHFEKKEVLRDIDFTFESGKIYGLLGRNGAGKTTLFNCLNRDMKAEGGSFYMEIDGQRRDVAPEDIGYVLSTPTVPEFLTGREFLKFFIDIHEDKLQNIQELDAYFDYIGISREDRDKLLKDYSHGKDICKYCVRHLGSYQGISGKIPVFSSDDYFGGIPL